MSFVGLMKNKYREDKVFWNAFLLGLITMLVYIFFYTEIERDAAHLYCAMIREFAEGYYDYAFFPAIPPLLTVIAGTIGKLGLEAFTAYKITSAFFVLACFFPLRSIMRRVLPNNLASWTCVVYIFSSYIIQNSIVGYPFALKMFFMVLSAYYIIVFAEKRRFYDALLIGFSLACLALARGEDIALIPLFVFWFILLPLLPKYRRKNVDFRPETEDQRLQLKIQNSKLKTQKASTDYFKVSYVLKKQVLGFVAGIIIFIAICLPQMIYVYHYTGVPLTEERTALIFKQKMDDIFYPHKAEIRQKKAEIKQKNEFDNLKPIDPIEYSLTNNIMSCFQGLYTFFVILALIGFVQMYRKRMFSILDIFFASIIVYNAAMFLGAHLILSNRYIATTQPFEFGWVVLGCWLIYDLNLFKYWKKLAKFVLIILLLVLFWGVNHPMRTQIQHGNKRKVVGDWIYQHRTMFPSKKHLVLNNYRTNRLPVIMASLPGYNYWAEGDGAGINGRYAYPYEKVIALMKKQNATVFIMDDRMKDTVPTFDQNYKKNFTLVKDFKKLNVQVYRLDH